MDYKLVAKELEAKTLYKFSFEHNNDDIFVGKSKFDTNDYIIAVQVMADGLIIFDAVNVLQDVFIDEQFYLGEMIEKQFGVSMDEENLIATCEFDGPFFITCQNVVAAMRFVKKNKTTYNDVEHKNRTAFIDRITDGQLNVTYYEDSLYNISLKGQKPHKDFTIYLTREDKPGFNGYTLIGLGNFKERLEAMEEDERNAKINAALEEFGAVYSNGAMVHIAQAGRLLESYKEMVEVMEYMSKK